MAYKVGQIRKTDADNTYMTDIKTSGDYGLNFASTISSNGVGATDFEDYAIKAQGNYKFNAMNTYYLRFTVERYPFEVRDEYIDPTHENYKEQYAPYIDYYNKYYNLYRGIINGEVIKSRGWDYYQHTNDINDPRCIYFRLILHLDHQPQNGNGEEYEVGEYQVISDNLKVQPWLPGKNSQYATFEITFTPNNTYPLLAFVISRGQVDYFLGQRRPFMPEEARLDFDEKGDIAIINNILPRASVDKIGVQTRPGALLCINKEPIRVGKSGTYEINNGVPISFVGMIAPNGNITSNIDRFILDYAWNE